MNNLFVYMFMGTADGNFPEGKDKGKVQARTSHEGPEGEKRYSSTLSLTSVLDVVDGCHTPASLPPGNTRYPLYRRLGRPQGRSGRVRKISSPLGFNPQTVQLLYQLCCPGPRMVIFLPFVKSQCLAVNVYCVRTKCCVLCKLFCVLQY